MSFSARLTEDIKTAMKAKDSVTLDTVRMLKSSLKYAAIEKLGAEGELAEGRNGPVDRGLLLRGRDLEGSFQQS